MAYLMTQAGAPKLQPFTASNPMRPGDSAAPPNSLYLENGRIKSAYTAPAGARLIARST